MFYTYLVEKYYFARIKQNTFWIIDLSELKNNLLELNKEVLKSGARFIFITQAINVPRYYKGVDTFNYKDILSRIDSLKNDPNYSYDAFEISALNQRLAVFYTIEFCEKYSILYINILNEVEILGSIERNEMFTDMGHKTFKGNSILGKLIGHKLNNLLKERIEAIK